MTKLRVLWAVWICTSALTLSAQEKMTPSQYIETYREFAIVEMYRSGVPASITLAQGMLESSYGNSRLAREGNNHFGIKCKGDWNGKTIRADDDAPNECFRAYNSALESYRDHSDFLRGNWRYHDLFDLQITDYKGWAEGLRKAGYATNTSYHTIIVNLIEKYDLGKYDSAPMPGKQQIEYTDNNVPMVRAQKDETMEMIARRNDLTVKQIYKYNDLSKGTGINEGDVVYLKPKRRRGTEKEHVVEDGETMYQISQAYGIKLKQLYKRNRLEEGTEVAAGQKIVMRGKIDKSDSVEVVTEKEKKSELNTNPFVNPHSLENIEKAPPLADDTISRPDFYIVQSGDNIYRIAEKYHVFEEDLVKWNDNLNILQLSVGQKIYLSPEAAQKAKTNSSETIKKGIQPNEIKTEAVISNQPTVQKAEINQPVVSDAPTKYHVVQAGETVYRICTTYKITAEQLQKWNNLSGNTIYTGQKLRVSE
ncbi:MAG: LysM peptidoglycan-binding domain-containing protein [Bacteroidetes bacterium]|nr:LysM peptidoglycan-binding domain-containing protein [Bacteroidota bacterium]